MSKQLRNAATGVVVEVRDDKELDGYEPVEPEKVSARRSASKAADDK